MDLGERASRVKFLIRDRDGKFTAEYTRQYNGHRPHQALQQRPPLREPGQAIDMTARIEHNRAVGGLISEYRRPA